MRTENVGPQMDFSAFRFLAMMICAVVKSRLDYCDEICLVLPVKCV